MKRFLWLICLYTHISFALPIGFVHLKYIDPSIIQDIRYYSTNNFVGDPLPGYKKPTCILTRETAFALAKIQQTLNRYHLGLKVFDCYRPQRAVNEFISWSKDPNDERQKSDYYPRVNKSDLFRLNYIAAKSGHSRGSTVDLTIVSFHKGKEPHELNMGTHFDYLDPASHPSSMEVSGHAYHNRMKLSEMMVEAGFVPLSTEWWHFTLVKEPHPNDYFDFIVE